MSLMINWEGTLARLQAGMKTVVDWERREGYVFDCAMILSDRLDRLDDARDLLVSVGTERPSHRLASRLCDLLLRQGDWSAAYDWSLEALALADEHQIQQSRVRCACIGMDYLSNRVEAKAYLTDYVEDGGRDPAALERLQQLIPDTDVDAKVDLLIRLMSVASSSEVRQRYRADLILLCEVSKAHWQKGLALFADPEMAGHDEHKLTLSAYRMARRLDEMETFDDVLSARGLSLPAHEAAHPIPVPAAQAMTSSRIEDVLRSLVEDRARQDIVLWIREAASLFGARIVPIIEAVADRLPIDRARLQIGLQERALEIAVNDLDLEVFPTSTYQLLGDGLCGAVGAGELRIRAVQMGNRFPQLRHLSLCLAGFEALGLGQLSKAESCFTEAVRLGPLGRAQARAARLLSWQKQDLDQVRVGLEREIEEVPRVARRDLQVELALLEESAGQLDRAEALYRNVINIARGWLPATYGLGTLLDRQGRWRELAAFVDDELMSTGGQEGRELSLIGRLAEIYEHHLDQLDSAADLYERILVHKPSAPDAILGLIRIYERQGRWNALVLLLESLAKVYTTDRSRAVVLYKAGEIAEFRMSDLEMAIPLYRSAGASEADPVFDWALESAVLKSQNRHELFRLYQNDSQLARFDVDVRRALSLSPSEALDAVESLMEADSHPIWAWLYSQLSCELQRPAHMAQGLSELAARLVPSEDQAGLLYEAFSLTLGGGAPVDRLNILSQVESTGPAGALVFQDLFALELSDSVLNERLLALVDWRLSGIASKQEADVLNLLRYLVTTLVEDREGIEAWASVQTSVLPGRWTEHVHAVGRHRVVQPGVRAAALLSLAERYQMHPSAGVRAFEAGRLFEQSSCLPQAVQAYRLALRADPDLLAAVTGLVKLVGVAITAESAFRALFDAAERTKSDAHRVSIIGTCLNNELTFDGQGDRSGELLEILAGLDAVYGFEQRIAMQYLADGDSTRALPLLETIVENSNEVETLGWAAIQMGELALADGGYDRAIEFFRKAVGVTPDHAGLSGLSVTYLKNGDFELARLSYRRLESLDEEQGGTTALEGRLGRMVCLTRMDRIQAAESLATDCPQATLNARSQFLLSLFDADMISLLPKLSIDLGQSRSNPTQEPSMLTAGLIGWMQPTLLGPDDEEDNQIEQGWRLQRQGWFQGSLVTTPELIRVPNALNRRVLETLLPDHVHPALVDSLATFARLNDLYGTDVSGPLAPLTPLETQRLRLLADCVGVKQFELRLDPVNAFRLDCKSGDNPCVIMGEGLFEAVSVGQLEFLVGWALVSVHMGAMPAHFMRAARRFGAKDLDGVLKWIERVANGANASDTSDGRWRGGSLFRRQLIDVIEWTSAHSVMEIDAVYEGLQTFGLRLAFSLAPCFGVPMETIRLIEMDDRTLDLLSVVERQEAVERSTVLHGLDAFSQNPNCLWARQQLFTLG
jgi:tetratricopeptide (TPR) repeat protein